eukprot:1158380-Pelagomonas_calceolata.AAC.8
MQATAMLCFLIRIRKVNASKKAAFVTKGFLPSKLKRVLPMLPAPSRFGGSQERAADKQAELDELRARRYQETKEREWRAKEKAAAERHATMQRELEDAREAQKAAKMLQRAEMAKVRCRGCCLLLLLVEHDEFMRVLAVNHARELEDLQMQAAALTINDKYKEELQAQIASNEELKKKERQVGLKFY